jgi:hypothetical protein
MEERIKALEEEVKTVEEESQAKANEVEALQQVPSIVSLFSCVLPCNIRTHVVQG